MVGNSFYARRTVKIMNEIYKTIAENRENLIKVTVSDGKNAEYKKIVVRPVIIKNEKLWQAERYKDNKVFHLNIGGNELKDYISDVFARYNQIDICLTDRNLTYYLTDGKIKKRKDTAAVRDKQSENHNRDKNFIIKEGDTVPALVDLGVFTQDYKIVKSMYDKYKQINRFIETIDDKFKNKPAGDEITVLDFGCGKSYLTFIIYYYFVFIKKIKAQIIGYDLKADVVEKCNEIAEKYSYSDLKFYKSDVTKDVLYDKKIDVIVSLHACDVATDYAIDYAIKKKVKYLFSVPCCQHEVNLSIAKNRESECDFDMLLSYGLIKERFSALLTDTIRAQILEDYGYSVDVNEFVDFSHSPKNVMIRAELKSAPDFKNKENILNLQEKYKFNQTLIKLAYENQI